MNDATELAVVKHVRVEDAQELSDRADACARF